MGTIVQSYFKPLDAVILCADLTRQVSFENTKYWHKQIVNAKQIPIIFVGNKCDLINDTEKCEDTREFMETNCKEWDIKSFQTSAKSGWNVNSAFYCAIYQVLLPALEIVKQYSEIYDQELNQRASAVIEESFNRQDPQLLVKSFGNFTNSAVSNQSSNLSTTQLKLIKSMTVGSVIEKGIDEIDQPGGQHNDSTKHRPSERVQLSRAEHKKNDSFK